MTYKQEKDSPLKAEKTFNSRLKLFDGLKPNFKGDMSKIEHYKIRQLPSRMTLHNTHDDYKDLLSTIKYDKIEDKVRFMSVTSSSQEPEKLKVRQNSVSLSGLLYQGVIPDDQYIKLPRVVYNLPEKNPHLSNQRIDGGRINVRDFKIQQSRNELMRA